MIVTMKFWFYDFLDELTENISKMWVQHKKKKNPNYKENANLKNIIRTFIRAFLIIALIVAIVSFGIQLKESL